MNRPSAIARAPFFVPALLALLLATFTTAPAAAEDTPPPAKLRVIVYDDPPFSMLDPSSGLWRGLAIELWHAVSDRMAAGMRGGRAPEPVLPPLLGTRPGAAPARNASQTLR